MTSQELDEAIKNADHTKVGAAWDQAMITYGDMLQQMRLKGYDTTVASKIAALHADATFLEEVYEK